MPNVNQFYKKKSNVVVFLSGSAGELDWILPIISYLKDLEFTIKLVFLTKHVKKSTFDNKLLRDFINNNSEIQDLECGGFFEFFEKLANNIDKVFNKLNFSLLDLPKKLVDKILIFIFRQLLPRELRDIANSKNLVFLEFPNQKKIRSSFLQSIFNHSLFFFCPHSPHIYAENLSIKKIKKLEQHSTKYLFLGDPLDYEFLKGSYNFNDLSLVYTGHPKYSSEWVKQYIEQKDKNYSEKTKTKILILSRGVGTYINEEQYKYLIDSTLDVIDTKFKSYELFIKKHPRENSSYWDKMKNQYPSINLIDDHIMQVAPKVDLVISYWTSGAMDCFLFNKPTIEFFNPGLCKIQQILEGNTYTTIYRKLGIVHSSNNKKDFIDLIDKFIKNNGILDCDNVNPFLSNLITRSDLWKNEIDNILLKHDIIS